MRGKGGADDRELLRHETRALLCDLITQHTGICEVELSQATGLSRNTVKYHLQKLEKAQIVRSCKQGRKLHYFPRGVHLLDLQRAIAGTQNDTRRRILRITHERPDMSWRAISRLLGVTPRAVRWHMQQMEALGLVTVDRHSGICRARLAPALEAVLTGDPAKLGDQLPSALQEPAGFRDMLLSAPRSDLLEPHDR